MAQRIKNLPNLPNLLPSAGVLGSVPGPGRFPGEGNGNHSSILAWRITWREEPGGLQSMGLQRVRHNGATNTHTLDQLN